MLGAVDGTQPSVCDCGLSCRDDGGCKAAADGCGELLDGVEDGVAISLLFLAQSVQAVGHDVAETEPDAQHEENIEYQDGNCCQLTGCKRKSQEADQGDTAAADDGNAPTQLIVEPAGERCQDGSDRRARQHHQTGLQGGAAIDQLQVVGQDELEGQGTDLEEDVGTDVQGEAAVGEQAHVDDRLGLMPGAEGEHCKGDKAQGQRPAESP